MRAHPFHCPNRMYYDWCHFPFTLHLFYYVFYLVDYVLSVVFLYHRYILCVFIDFLGIDIILDEIHHLIGFFIHSLR